MVTKMVRSKLRNCIWYFIIFMMMYVTMMFMIQFQTETRQTIEMVDHISTVQTGTTEHISHSKTKNTERTQHNFQVSKWPHYRESGENETAIIQNKISILSSNRKERLFFGTENFTNHKFESVNFIKVGDIFVYAAHVDTRLGNSVVVRFLTLQRSRMVDGLMCRFFHDNKLIIFADKYEMCENHGKDYGGWIYSCVLPNNVEQIPQHVQLSTISEAFWDHLDYPQLELSPLQYSSPMENSKIGVCVPPLFGNISLQLLINYIELMKILGVSKVFFYKYNISKSTESLLKYYAMSGDVDVFHWMLPTNITEDSIWYNGQLLAIQHCLYHNMAEFQFLMFVDLDEVLIPKQSLHLLPMLHGAVKQSGIPLNRIAAFSFQSAFFDSRQLPDPTQKITIFQHLERTKITSKVRTKLVVQANRIFELGIHHLSRPITDNVTVVHVDPETALVHHYRECVVSYDKEMHCYPTVRDESMLRYSKLLEKTANTVLKKVMQYIY